MLCSQNFYPVFAWIFLTDFNQAVLHGKASGDSGEVWGERKRRWAYQTGPSKKFFNDKLKELNIEQLWYLRNCQKVSAIVKKNNRLSQVAEVFLHLHQQHRTTWTQVLRRAPFLCQWMSRPIHKLQHYKSKKNRKNCECCLGHYLTVSL